MARIVIFGLVTRKLHVVYENVDGKQEWYEWAKQAVKSVYGYDWQGDTFCLLFFTIKSKIFKFKPTRFAPKSSFIWTLRKAK